MRRIRQTLLAPAFALALLGATLWPASHSLAVQEEQGVICLWSSSGPVAVARPPAAKSAEPRPEQLLATLLAGPMPEEAAEGISSAIPPGTSLDSVEVEADGAVAVYLRMPQSALQTLDHGSFDAIFEQIARTLESLHWRELSIQTLDPESLEFVPLASFLPQIAVPGKDPAPTAEETPASPVARAGQPAASGQGQPQGALSGKTVYVSAGHGWWWTDSGWATQRSPYPEPPYAGPIIEDHNNAEVVNQYLLQYLWNAGAMVWPVRERDMNGAEAIVDDGGAGYVESAGWTTVSPYGYGNGSYAYALTTTCTAGATVTWNAELPAEGRYAVYVWFRPGTNRAPDARYTVHHAGGETSVAVNQQHHGYTWYYIGSYAFRSGEAASVTLDNHSSCGDCVVIADAVRFGGGTFSALDGITTDATYAPVKPWYEMAAFYYSQKMGINPDNYDDFNDVIARPIYARWEHAGTGDDAVYVSWHTNGFAGTSRGTESYAHSGDWLPRTDGSIELRHSIHSELINDIRAGWDADWPDRGERLANFGELRLLWDEDPADRMPGALIEIAYHDNPTDADALRDPQFELLAARALYQGIAKYFLGPGAPLLPEPPSHLVLANRGEGQVEISWLPPGTDGSGLVGHAATAYRVYISSDGLGWSNGVAVAGNQHTVSGLEDGQLLFVRVTATNPGGESFPTEVLAVRVGDDPQILLVNGFDRLNHTMLPLESGIARMYLDQINSFDYAIEHGQALPHPFDSASNEALRDGLLSASEYSILDWMLGEESGPDQTLDPAERSLIHGFLEDDGALFLSGTEVGYHLVGQGADPIFYNEMLHAGYAGDDAGTYDVEPAPGSVFDGLGQFAFDSPGTYDADYPDRLSPLNGSRAALTYSGGLGGAAGIEWADGCARLVYFGFPFETIAPSARGGVMERALTLLGLCASIGSPGDGGAYNHPPSCEGTSRALDAPIDQVQLQLRRLSDGRYWSGAGWQEGAAWFDAQGGASWGCSLPALDEGQYALLAQAEAGGSADVWPPVSVFTYDTIAPTSTLLITPTGGITITGLPVAQLEWLAVEPDGGSAISYRVSVDGEYYSSAEPGLGLFVSGDGTHTWGVQVMDAAGNASTWITDTFVITRTHAWLPAAAREAQW
jgi:N-acetylmuramoyl-L-alanine amidase